LGFLATELEKGNTSMLTFAAHVFTLALLSAGIPVTIDGLTSTAPASWKESPTTSSMRFKQFIVPGGAGDKSNAELVIFFFGPGQGGGAEANIARWKGMFLPPDGKKIDDVSKVETIKVGEVNTTILEVRGTYRHKPMPMAPEEELRPNHRMIGVVFDSPKGPYFMRFVGPEKTVDKHKKDFDRWLRGFKK
jgi:hypothetical protein